MTNNTKTDYSALARWLCLYEAVNIISEKAEKIGNTKDCLKPIPINKYISERFHSVLKDIEYEYKREPETINNNLRKRHR